MRPLLLAALLLSLAACDGGVPQSMVSIRPPTHWDRSVVTFRAAKDERFRNSPDSPLLAADVEGFAGLEYWQPDPGYYFAGPMQVYAQKERFDIITTAGAVRPCEKFGRIEFPLSGRETTLEVYRLLDIGRATGVESLLVPFTDGTTGVETYPSGRYVDLAGPAGEIYVVAGADGHPLAPGPFVLDFNRAYNPSCAYGEPERFACPVTPKANRLEKRIEAGERGYKPAPGEPVG